MPAWMRYCLILAMAAWAFWYFGKMLIVGLRTGEVIDRPAGGKPITRKNGPIGFWLSMAIAAAMAAGMPYLFVLLVGDLAGFWESGV